MTEITESTIATTDAQQPQFCFALMDLAVIGTAVSITALLCCAAYLIPESSVDTAARAPILTSIQTPALANLPRTVLTCQELLRRADVDHRTLHAALVRLGRLQQKTPSELIVESAASVDISTDDATIKNLSRLAEAIEDKDRLRAQTQTLANTGHSLPAREVATAMLISIDGNAAALFADANKNTEQLTALLKALPLVHSVEIQSRVYDSVRRLLLDKNETRLELKRTAITTMVHLRGREEIKAVDLIRLVEFKGLQNAAIEGFSQLPTEAWPQEELPQLANRLTSWIAYHPPEERRSPEIQTAIRLARRISERFTGKKKQRLLDRLTKLQPETD